MKQAGSILVVEDERSMREFLEILLTRQGHTVDVANGGVQVFEQIERNEYDVVITDLKMPQVSGLEVLERVKRKHPETEVIMVTAFATTETAIAAMKQGAYDYLNKPFKVDEITVTVERALEKRALVRDNVALRAQLQKRFRLEGIVGRSPAMQQLFSMVRKVASTKTSLVIQGESGTGKELVARAVHSLSDRSEQPFIAVNCGAIPETLMESELFGHVRGAFTGATHDRNGLFTAADGGTLFLDEIGELSITLQVKLLRALQERRIKPVGATNETTVDVRIIAASNRDLEKEVAEGRFRSDLFYRLNVISLAVPPLRERTEDIPLLAEHFARKFAAEMGRSIHRITPDAMATLCQYSYPGNVRELENLIERAVTLSSTNEIDIESLPDIRPGRVSEGMAQGLLSLPEQGLDLEAHIGAMERELLVQALARTHGNRTEAAQLLKISLRSLRYRLAKYGVDVPEPTRP